MRCLLLVTFALLPFVAVDEDTPLLENHNFRTWVDGVPSGWEVSIGARQGQARESKEHSSRLLQSPAGLTLEGNAAVETWRYLRQQRRAVPNRGYRLMADARVRNIALDPGQYDNCYVSLVFRDKEQGELSRMVRTIAGTEWNPTWLTTTSPAQAHTVEVAIFLSKSGRLEIKALDLQQFPADESFQALVDELQRHYSFFAAHDIDWQGLCKRYRKRAVAAQSAQGFLDVVKEMLGELKDQHVWIHLHGKKIIPTYRDVPDQNFDYKVVAATLSGVRQFGRTGFTGRTSQGFGYVAVGSLQGPEKEFEQLLESLHGLLATKGILIDIRANGGGSEARAQRIAAYFTDEERIYARTKIRSGVRPQDLVEVAPRSIRPDGQRHFSGPVVCLIGPVCMSSGEGMAMMMKAIPTVTLLGQATRGASGNPRVLQLPNGVDVHYSTWISLLPDGTSIERRGIQPDIEVAHKGDGDQTFLSACAALDQLVKKKKP